MRYAISGRGNKNAALQNKGVYCIFQNDKTHTSEYFNIFLDHIIQPMMENEKTHVIYQ